MNQYILKQPDGHLVIDVEGEQVLIDSGAPTSVGDQPEWTFMDQMFPLIKNYMGVTTEFLSQQIDTPIDILLGSDILKTTSFMVDTRGEIVVFDPEEPTKGGVKVPLSFSMSIPMINVILDGNPILMFLDTGAKISYLKKELVSTIEQVGTANDFYPGYGEFKTPVFRVPMIISGEEITLSCGVLPQLLEFTLLLGGSSGIIGTELMKEYKILFSYQKNEVSLFQYKKADDGSSINYS